VGSRASLNLVAKGKKNPITALRRESNAGRPARSPVSTSIATKYDYNPTYE